MKRSIVFRVDGDFGNKYGSGHILRCLKIYKILKKNYKNKYNFLFLSKKKFGSIFIKSQTNEKVFYYKKNFKNFPINQKDIVVVDTLGIENSFLKFLKMKNISKIISFDETNISNYTSAIIINGILFTKKKLFSKRKKIKIYQGLKYLLLDKEFAKSKKSKSLSKKKTVLICSGGNDKKNFTSKIINSIKNFEDLRIKIIIGKGVSPLNSLHKFQNYKNISLVKSQQNLFYHLNSSDLSFVSGGTIMFESICCGIVPFVLETYQNQKYAIKFFRKKNLISYLGRVDKINSKTLGKKIKLLLEKKKLKRNNNIIDGKGIYRIAKIFEKIL